jgi:plastocyanin
LHRKRYLCGLGLAIIVAVSWTALAAGAPKAGSVTILAKDKGISFVPNQYIQDHMAFAPGTVTVKSGDSITFKFGDAKAMEPHTLTLVKQSELPKTSAQVENCKPCERYATPHLKNPKAPPDEKNPIVHWTLDKGNPGLDVPGDSVAIQQPGPHKSISVKVSAPAGTTLYFVCAVHPWMQGKIVVT